MSKPFRRCNIDATCSHRLQLLRQCNALQKLDSVIMELSLKLLGNGPKSMADLCNEMYQDGLVRRSKLPVRDHLRAANGALAWLTARPETFDVYQPNPDEKGVWNVRLHDGGACSR
jgi:hypothetical protein